MDSITINHELYTEMLKLYTTSSYKKIFKNLHKCDYVINLACKTASEFDKVHGIIEIDKILDFVALQIIIRITSNNNKNYHKCLIDNADYLLDNSEIIIDDEEVIDIFECLYNDAVITKCIHAIAAEKLMKLLEVFDDNIVFLTKSFCKVINM